MSEFTVQPFAEIPDLTPDQLADSMKEVPPEDPASFEERLLKSITVSVKLDPLDVEIKGGATF